MKEKNFGVAFWTTFGREKPSKFHSEQVLGEKYLEIPFQSIFQREKTSEFYFEPVSGREKTSEFRSKSFSEKNNFWIPFQPDSRNRKHSKIRSKPFLATENTWKKTPLFSCFVKLFRGVLFRSVQFRTAKVTLPKNTEFRMSTLFRRITKTVPSLLHGIFSKGNSMATLKGLSSRFVWLEVVDPLKGRGAEIFSRF